MQIGNPTKHSPPTKRFEALIDSGASYCIFHYDIARAIGLDVEKGEKDETVGVSGTPSTIYLHNVSLYVLSGIIKIRAAFSSEIPLAGVLGRKGFFEHFKITFDPSTEPPSFELERIYRT